MHTQRLRLALSFALGLAGCGAASRASDRTAAPIARPEDPTCQRGVLEPDLRAYGATTDAPLEVPAGRAVFSATYLRLSSSPESARLFQTLMTDIAEATRATPGLLVYRVATSERCMTARTLSVWRDERSMFAFVTGRAHGAAVAAVGRVSRGGSTVTHWEGDAADATWTAAATRLAATDGPFY